MAGATITADKGQMDTLGRALLSALERFYSDPDNVSRFEAWMMGPEGVAYAERQKASK